MAAFFFLYFTVCPTDISCLPALDKSILFSQFHEARTRSTCASLYDKSADDPCQPPGGNIYYK